MQAKIKDSYKQVRHDDDLNQPLSIQPWGRDELKRRYWLIEGQDDTHFRLYRESNPALKTNTWWSVAGTIDEIREVGEKLEQEKSQHSKKLSERIMHAIPRFEGGEEVCQHATMNLLVTYFWFQKRRRRDYRLARKAAFSRPEPGFSLYEGRTRGKKLKYTYSDDEDIFSDDLPTTRRSTRNASGITTPGEPAGPTITASGRQVRARAGGIYGESMLSGQRAEYQADEDEDEEVRPQRSTRGQANGYTSRYANDASDEESEAASSWKGDDESNNENDDFEGDDEEEQSEDESMLDIDESEQNSLVVHLHYGKTNPNQQLNLVDGLVSESGGIPDSNPTKTEVVTDLSKKPLEKPTAEGGSQAAATTNGSSEEKHHEQTVPSSTAIPSYEYSKENVSAQGMKSEDVSAKPTQEPAVAPLEPSRVHNGHE